jgi:hypothetical protein
MMVQKPLIEEAEELDPILKGIILSLEKML